MQTFRRIGTLLILILALAITGVFLTACSDSEEAEGSFSGTVVTEEGVYDSKEDVSEYIHLYDKLPSNYITKKEARKLGWTSGGLDEYAPGKCIGGDRFGNYEGNLPSGGGVTYKECDIDTLGADRRGAKRIVYDNQGNIYYTEDHYETFEQLYDEEGAIE